MEEGFGHYLSWALLLCFGDSPEHQQRVMECKNHPNKLNDLCDELASRNVLMYFVIDQANSFDLDLDNNDEVTNEVKVDARRRIFQIAFHHYAIWSATANHKAAARIAQIQNYMKIKVYGGYTKARGLISSG